MAELRPDVQQVVEVPVNTCKRPGMNGMNIGNLLIAGGIFVLDLHLWQARRTQPRLCSAKRPPPAIARGDTPR